MLGNYKYIRLYDKFLILIVDVNLYPEIVNKQFIIIITSNTDNKKIKIIQS